MAYVPYHLQKVARWSKIVGIYSVLLFVLAAIVLALIENVANTGRLRFQAAPFVIIWAFTFLVPGVLLYVFGRMLDAGRMWTCVPIVLLILFEFVKIFIFRLALGVCMIWLRLPHVVLFAVTINAIPEMRDQWRRWRRQRQPRGFPVITATKPVVTPPPPAGRSVTKRDGDSRFQRH